ncbi:MAG: right-handed parallel beta-helix repeat-containing protein [Planctomycetota bacterium]|nr:right-handed parallel beta-helix repeat-containing protein [Planctomycetota bacterium]
MPRSAWLSSLVLLSLTAACTHEPWIAGNADQQLGRQSAFSDLSPTAVIRVNPDGSGDYSSLPEALAAAPSGARVIIARGNYRGSLILEKSVILEAQDSRPSLEGTEGPTLIVRTEHVTLRGLILHAPRTGPTVVVERGELDMDRCVVVGGNSDGIQVTSSKSNARLVQSTVTSSDDVGIRVAAGASASLVEAEITRNGTGIALAGGTLQSKETRIAYNETGLLVSGPGDCTVEGGFLWSNTTVGLHLDQSTRAKFLGVTIRAPGGVPGVTISRNSRGQFDQCTVSGTPMEADHHVGNMTRDHIATELRDGTDHHILTGLLTVESQSSPVFRDCLIENSLGHGLLIRDSSPLFESTRIVGSVFYNIFLTDRAAPTFRHCSIRNAGENGLFSWTGSGGLFEKCLLEGNGKYRDDKNNWAQVVLADASTTRFLDCIVRGGGGAGVVASGFGTRGEFLRCEIIDHAGPGISVSAGGNPKIHHTKVRNNGGTGLWITRGGQGHYQDLEITGNGGFGALFEEEASAPLKHCQLELNAKGGMLTRRSATPRLESCSLSRNNGNGVQVDFDGHAVLDDCEVTLNKGSGVLVKTSGHAVLLGTEVQGNAEQQIFAEEGAQLEVKD